jgi:hypothetical protein
MNKFSIKCRLGPFDGGMSTRHNTAAEDRSMSLRGSRPVRIISRLEALCEQARKNNALLAKLSLLLMSASARRTSCAQYSNRVPHYPTATSAIAIPTLATDRPPTIEASQTTSRASLRTDFHIGLLSPQRGRRTAGATVWFLCRPAPV